GPGARDPAGGDRARRLAAAVAGREPGRGGGRGAARRPRADAARARARAPRLRGEERLPGDRGRRFGRDRLGGRRRARRGGAGAGTGALRVDAVTVLVGGDTAGRAAPGGEPRLSVHGAADRARRGGLP